MPDTCTIAGNAITCTSQVDWVTIWSALVPAVIGIAAALLAAMLANRHQRHEASKQRKIIASAAIMRAAFSMVRNSHRNKDKMRDFASEFEISIRILSIELQTAAGRAFIEELTAWRRSIAYDCRRLPELSSPGFHDTPEINEVRSKLAAFVGYIDEWLHTSDRALAALTETMHNEWKVLWPDVEPERRLQPRLGDPRPSN